MNSTLYPEDAQAPAAAPLPAAARAAFALLARMQHGTLTVMQPDGVTRSFGHGRPHATLELHDWEVCARTLASGDIGFAEAYMAGQWTTPSLADLLGLFIRNRNALDNAVYGSWFGRIAYRIRHLLARNTRAGSRRNIQAHYDLGNDFYTLWLDPTMNYSSAWFQREGMTLPQAQDAKVFRALRMADAGPGKRVLEIGCGWGALAEMGAREFGAHVTGVTLSHEQLAYGKDRVARAGMAGSTDLRLQDYRDIQDAPYDAICSIEMVEAVGRQFWPQYFQTVSRLLKRGGRACIQSITIDEALWPRYIRGTDFIQQYVFPGGCLPTKTLFAEQARAAGLEVVDTFSFGNDYARTLHLWRERFLAERTRVQALGFDDSFMRLWEFYLCYCEAAFAQGNTDVVQFTLAKP